MNEYEERNKTMAVAERRAEVTWQGNLTQGQGVASLIASRFSVFVSGTIAKV